MITINKQAHHDYSVSDIFEAGLILSGPEVKSVKAGGINLKGSYIDIKNDSAAYLVKAHISAYKPASSAQLKYNPDQDRKLLLNKKELKHLFGKSKESGVSIIPLKVYLKHGLVKLEIGVGKGKKKYDKREDIKKRDFARRKQQLKQY